MDEHQSLLSPSRRNEDSTEQYKHKESVESDDPHTLSPIRQKILLLTLLCLHFRILCSDSLLYPFYGTAANRKGLVDTQIGFVYSSYEIVRCVAAPLYGVLITTLKPREMCFIGSLSCGISTVLFGVVYYTQGRWFFPLCLVIRILAGNGSVMFTVGMTAGLMKATNFKSSTIIAAMEASQAAGYCSGPLIGAGLYQVGGYSLCFLFIGAITTLLSFLILPTVPNIGDTKSINAGVGEFIKIMSIPGVLIGGFLVMAMTKLSTNMVFSFAAEWFQSEYGLNETQVATFYIVAALLFALTCYPVSVILSKGYVWTVIVVPSAIIVILMLLFTPKVIQLFFPSIHYEWWYTVIMYGVNTGLQSPLLIAPYEASLNLASVNGYDNHSLLTHGLLAGVVNSGLNFGAAVSPMISGVITEKLGFYWVTILSASIFFVMTMVYISYLSIMKCTGKPLRPPL